MLFVAKEGEEFDLCNPLLIYSCSRSHSMNEELEEVKESFVCSAASEKIM